MKKIVQCGCCLSLIVSLCAFSYWHIAKSETKPEFSFADVVAKAKQLSLSPYIDNKADLPASLAQMRWFIVKVWGKLQKSIIIKTPN